MKAREAVDVDEPSIEGLQTLLLLSMAFFAAGKGKKSYMMLCRAFQHSTILKIPMILTASSKCRWDGLRVRLTPRKAKEDEDLVNRARDAAAPLLVLLYDGSLHSMWFETSLLDFGQVYHTTITILHASSYSRSHRRRIV